MASPSDYIPEVPLNESHASPSVLFDALTDNYIDGQFHLLVIQQCLSLTVQSRSVACMVNRTSPHTLQKPTD